MVTIQVKKKKFPHIKKYESLNISGCPFTVDCFTMKLVTTDIYNVTWPQLTPRAKKTYNVHNDRIYKEHRNLRIRKHVTTSCSGTKPFY